MEGEQRRVEQNGPQDEQGGPEGLDGEDLAHPQNDAVCHLRKRAELGEDVATGAKTDGAWGRFNTRPRRQNNSRAFLQAPW